MRWGLARRRPKGNGRIVPKEIWPVFDLQRRDRNAAPVMQLSSTVSGSIVQGRGDGGFVERETVVGHVFVERAAVAAVGINDEHFRGRVRMRRNEARQVLGVTALVEHVTADDEIKATERVVFFAPMACLIFQRRQCVEQ